MVPGEGDVTIREITPPLKPLTPTKDRGGRKGGKKKEGGPRKVEDKGKDRSGPDRDGHLDILA